MKVRAPGRRHLRIPRETTSQRRVLPAALPLFSIS